MPTTQLPFPSLIPGNPHDDRLRALVHPPEWRNPRPRGRYHLVVIGGGTGGLVSAAIAAGLGARVALVERALMGGDCLNVGCVPSKALIHAARDSSTRTPAGFAAAMDRMRAIRADIAPVDSAERYRSLGVDVFIGQAAFAGAGAVTVGDAHLRFRRAIVASGGRPALPPIDGLGEIGALTNESVFGLRALPARMAIIGGGSIGCELAQALARFGCRVTLLEATDRLLPNDAPEAAEVIAGALRRDGVDVRFGARIERAELAGVERRLIMGGGDALVTDEVLVAAGRAPNLEGLALDRANVRFTQRGITVDDKLQTSNPRVYAVGDVASRHQFTHAADALARIAVPNALFFGFGGGKASSLVMPWCTYTSPEVAHVGLPEADAADRSDVETITLPLTENDRARIDGDSEGFFRIHLERGTDRILGATLVAERAGDMIGEIGLAITNKVGLGGIGRTIHPYPTVASVFARAADVRRRERLTPLVRRAFGVFFRIFR